MDDASRLTPDADAGPVAFVFHDQLKFHRAKVLLERAGLLWRYRLPGGNLGAYGMALGMPQMLGILWVCAEHVDQAVSAFENAGLPAAFGVPPLVDRREPVCPCCGAALDAAGGETCPQCRCAFQWLDVKESAKVWRMSTCEQCGYDLRNITSDRCPECGTSVLTPADVEDQPGVSVATPLRRAGHLVRRSRMFWIGLMVFLLGCPCVVLVPLQLLASADPAEQVTAVIVVAVLIGLGILIGRGMLRRD